MTTKEKPVLCTYIYCRQNGYIDGRPKRGNGPNFPPNAAHTVRKIRWKIPQFSYLITDWNWPAFFSEKLLIVSQLSYYSLDFHCFFFNSVQRERESEFQFTFLTLCPKCTPFPPFSDFTLFYKKFSLSLAFPACLTQNWFMKSLFWLLIRGIDTIYLHCT